MKGLPRGVFDALVQEEGSDKHCKGFRSWDHLMAMVYGQLSGASSLRELTLGLNRQSVHHYHLGTRRLSRSTLADANARRSPALFEAVARHLMARVSRSVRRDSKPYLQMLDSTTISLTGRGHDWAQASRTRCGQGLKLHVLWDAQSQAPRRQALSTTNVNDRDAGVTLPLDAGVTYVFDKAYCDYQWWATIGQQGAKFITRFKCNAGLVVERCRPIAKASQGSILADEVVTLKHRHARGGRPASPPLRLRRILVARKDKAPLVLATNDLKGSAQSIADGYKARWGIELFFKWIKQHLRIKRFLGENDNAVRIQLLCALIAHLLVSLYHQQCGQGETRWEFLAALRATLFQRPQTDAHNYRRRCERRAEIEARQGLLNV
jgi:IS4 transposase